MIRLKDPDLLRQQAFVSGQWCDASHKGSFAVVNPATGETLATVPDMQTTDANAAIAAAEAALPGWRNKTAKERAGILRRWYELIVAAKDDLALLMTAEQGKPLAEAGAEVLYGAAFVEWFAEEAKRVYGDLIPAQGVDKRILVTREPVGVVAAITPWNFPNAMITRKCAPALAAGCTLVIKPAEDTPLSALALAVLAERAGIPAGVLNVVTTASPVQVGKALTASSVVRKLSFTGSTAVGKQLLAQCADTVKKVSLELGGNAPFIVFDDADLEQAVAGAITSKFRNSGQTCVCANRILVQAGIYDTFVKHLAEAMQTLSVGPGLEGQFDQGPLINTTAVDKVTGLLSNATEQGASIVCGGKLHALGGTFFEPTLVTHVTQTMRIAQEEVFGPVAPVYRFESEQEAVALANDTQYGLAAYFYTRDLARAWRVSAALEYGMVAVNEGALSTEVAPFGGIKESGIGREGSRYGIDEYLEIKYTLMGGLGEPARSA